MYLGADTKVTPYPYALIEIKKIINDHLTMVPIVPTQLQPK